MIRILRFLFLTLMAAAFFISPPPLFAQNAGSGNVVRLEVDNCNNNGICEPQFGENYQGCPTECSASTLIPPAPPNDISNSGAAPTNVNRLFPINAIKPESIRVTLTASSSAIIEWQTYGDALSLLSWGKTADGELGTIAEIKYGVNHKIEINNLDLNTRYFYKIESKAREGLSTYLEALSFVTATAPIPINVKNFNASLKGSSIILSWKNPVDVNFQYIQIRRSQSSYPLNPNAGKLIYQGIGTSTIDRSIKAGGSYYYSIFTRNISGLYSSGAVTFLKLAFPLTIKKPTTPILTLSSTTLPSSTFFNVGIEQKQKQIYLLNYTAELEISSPIKFFLPINSFSSTLSTIIISIENEEKPGTFNSFLLQPGGNKGILETIIPAFNKTRNLAFVLTALDKDGNSIVQTEGILKFKEPSTIVATQADAWYLAFFRLIIGLFHKVIEGFIPIFNLTIF